VHSPRGGEILITDLLLSGSYFYHNWMKSLRLFTSPSGVRSRYCCPATWRTADDDPSSRLQCAELWADMLLSPARSLHPVRDSWKSTWVAVMFLINNLRICFCSRDTRGRAMVSLPHFATITRSRFSPTRQDSHRPLKATRGDRRESPSPLTALEQPTMGLKQGSTAPMDAIGPILTHSTPLCRSCPVAL